MLRALRFIASPAQRYRHARVLHGARVALAMLTSILITSGIDIPHGIWASVSLLVVIGGLQHQGNIRQKAFERAIGTAFGALIGLACVAQYAFIGSTALTYLLLSAIAGVCAYHAIGKGGYIALLTAITMFIVAGHGDDSIEIGLWRSANVLVGIGIALLFSFAFPLLATYSWRYGVAANLRGCAKLCKRLLAAAPMTAEQQIAAFGALSTRLVSLRGLMPSVAKESGVGMARLEEIQRTHRSLLSALEMLASAPSAGADSPTMAQRGLRSEGDGIRRVLLQAARGLRSGRAEPLLTPVDLEAVLPISMPPSLQGRAWLLGQMALQAERLQRQLIEVSHGGLFQGVSERQGRAR